MSIERFAMENASSDNVNVFSYTDSTLSEVSELHQSEANSLQTTASGILPDLTITGENQTNSDTTDSADKFKLLADADLLPAQKDSTALESTATPENVYKYGNTEIHTDRNDRVGKIVYTDESGRKWTLDSSAWGRLRWKGGKSELVVPPGFKIKLLRTPSSDGTGNFETIEITMPDGTKLRLGPAGHRLPTYG